MMLREKRILIKVRAEEGVTVSEIADRHCSKGCASSRFFLQRRPQRHCCNIEMGRLSRGARGQVQSLNSDPSSAMA